MRPACMEGRQSWAGGAAFRSIALAQVARDEHNAGGPLPGKSGERSMDQQAYNRWWALHVRVALGETLAAADHGFYEAGMKERDADDELHGAGQAVGKARAALATLDAENAQLRPE